MSSVALGQADELANVSGRQISLTAPALWCCLLAKCTVRCSHHQGGTTFSHVFSSFFCQSVRGR